MHALLRQSKKNVNVYIYNVPFLNVVASKVLTVTDYSE